jgi:hypothetical protein
MSEQSKIPPFCNTKCEHFHVSNITGIGIGPVLLCCFEDNEKHWIRRRLDGLSGCVKEK